MAFSAQYMRKLRLIFRTLKKLKEFLSLKTTLECNLISLNFSLEKSFSEEIDIYKKEILEIQEVKEGIIKAKNKEIDNSLEKFVEKSKDLIHSFKVDFKKFIATPITNLTSEEIEKKIGLKKLKEDLYSEEIYLKYKMAERIKEYDNVLKKEDDIMAIKTTSLRENLDRIRKKFKNDLSNSYTECIDGLNKNENRNQEEEDLFNDVS